MTARKDPSPTTPPEPAPMHLLEALQQVVLVAERRRLELRDLRAAAQVIARALREELREGDTATVDGATYTACTVRDQAQTATRHVNTLAVRRGTAGTAVTLDAQPIRATVDTKTVLMPAANDAERLRFLKHADRVIGTFRGAIDQQNVDMRQAVDATTKLGLL